MRLEKPNSTQQTVRKNIQKHARFFAKIKIDHRKTFFCDKKIASKSVFFSSQNTSLWASKDPSFQAIFKIMKNSQVGAENLGKTADFVISLIFSTLMLLTRMFLNIFTNRLLR